jgi:hypothetical protein
MVAGRLAEAMRLASNWSDADAKSPASAPHRGSGLA